MVQRQVNPMRIINGTFATLLIMAVAAHATPLEYESELLKELSVPLAVNLSPLEVLVFNSSPREAAVGYATYYASRFIGRKTTSGFRYNPDKMTAAHYTLPLGTLVRVVNPTTSQMVEVKVNDRCAPKRFPFVDLSRAAAKKIGLWGKGIMKVVIIPLPEDMTEEPA